MIKALFVNNSTGKRTTMFGLSAKNVEKLQQGMPIRIRISEISANGLEPDDEIVIFTGDTEESMQAEITELMRRSGR